jgi:hypothetical protein
MRPVKEAVSMSRALNEMHEYLLADLVPLLGFPATIRRIEGVGETIRATRLDSGCLAIRLAGPKGMAGEDWIVLSREAAADPFCRKMANRFSRLGYRVAESCKRPWDIKATLIREEQFLWDNAVIGTWYSGNQKYNVLNLLGAIREVLSFRYEGNPVEVGVLASWNWHDIEPQLRAAGCTMLKFGKKFDLRDGLRTQKTMHLLANGRHSLFVTSPFGMVRSWLSFPDQPSSAVSEDWNLVPPEFKHFQAVLTGRDLVMAATPTDEVFLFRHDTVLKWFRHRWYRVSGPPLEEQIKLHLPTQLASTVAELSMELSRRRVGALIAVARDAEQLLRSGSEGLAQHFASAPLFSVAAVAKETLLQLAAVDGCLIIDSNGMLRNAGVILRLPADHVAVADGARAAATQFASTFGLAIKISHDGPVSIYEDGKLIRAA